MSAALAEGQQEEQTYRANGFNDDDVNQWKTEQVAQFQKNGFSQSDINDYFGTGPKDASDIQKGVKDNLEKWKDERKDENGKMPPHEATTFGEGLQAAFEGSVAGTWWRSGAPPDVLPPEHQGFAQRMAEKFEQYGMDAQVMAAGAFGGAILGAGAGVATAGPPGVPVGMAAGAGFGAFAAPAFIREMLVQHYQKPDGIHDPQEFMSEVGAAAWKATKEGIPGAIGAATGALAKPVLGVATGLGAEYLSMVGSQAAIAQHLPTWNEFQDGALMMGVLHTPEVASKLMNIYAKTGERPADIAEATQADPVLKQEIASIDPAQPEQAAPKEAQEEPIKAQSQDNVPDDLAEARKNVLARRSQVVEPEKPSWLTPSGFKENIGKLGEKVYSGITNQFNPFANDETKAGFESENGGFDSAYTRALNFKSWKGKLQRALFYNTTDYRTGAVTGEGLKPIADDIKKAGGDEFWAFAMSKRAVERAETGPQGQETGINLDDANKIIAADSERFQPLLDRLTGFQNRMLKYAKDSELISQESYDRIMKGSSSYLPFLREQDMDPFMGEAPKGKGQIAPMMKGSDKKIIDPRESIFFNTSRIFEAAERNAVPLNFVKMVEGSDNPGALAEKVEKPTGASNEFTFKRNGQEEAWRTRPETADALKAVGFDPDISNAIAKLLMLPGRVLRFGTVDVPDFLIRHFIRQAATGSVYSKMSNVPVVDSFKYAYHTLTQIGEAYRGGETFQKYLSSGATAGTMTDLGAAMDKIWGNNKEAGNFLDRTWNVARSLKQGIEWSAFMADTPQRLAEFKLMGGAKEGATISDITKAASAAREVTLDYDRAGSQLKVWRALTPFMNIGIQGVDRLAREIKDNPGKLAAAGSTLTALTAANWALNHKDSRYQDAPQWEKDLYWLFPTDKWEGGTAQDAMSRPPDLRRQLPDGSWEVNNGTTIKISKPFELGVIFGSFPERLLNKYADENPHQIEDFKKTLIDGVVPNVIPTGILPMLESMTNHNIFMDRPIIPDHLQKVAPEMQYMPYTSGFAKQLGKMLGYVPGLAGSKATSPLIIDNWVREWSGTAGKYALQIADAAPKAYSEVKDNGMAGVQSLLRAIDLKDVPIVTAFISRNPSMGMQPIQDFYTAYDKAMGVKATADQMQKERRAHEAAQYLMDNNGSSLAALQPIHDALKTQTALVRQINDSKYPPDQKRQLIDTAYYQMWNMAKQGVKITTVGSK